MLNNYLHREIFLQQIKEIPSLNLLFFFTKCSYHNSKFIIFLFVILGQYVMVWQKGQDVLSAKSIMVTADPRIKLVNHHNLQIRSIKLSDAGDYQCKIHVLGDPIVIIHTLEILGKLKNPISFSIIVHNVLVVSYRKLYLHNL